TGLHNRYSTLCAAEPIKEARIHVSDRHTVTRRIRIARERTEVRTGAEERGHETCVFIRIAARQRVDWREWTPALHKKDAVELPTAYDAPQSAFLLAHERQLPEEVGREDVARVETRIAPFGARVIERILRDGDRVAAVEREDFARIVNRVTIGVAEAVVQLLPEAPVIAHLQGVVDRADSVDALAYRPRLEQPPVADRFVLEWCRRIVNAGDRLGVRWQQIREAGESDRLLRIRHRVDVGAAETINQVEDERIGVDCLEELGALVADVAHLKNIVPE